MSGGPLEPQNCIAEKVQGREETLVLSNVIRRLLVASVVGRRASSVEV